MQIILRHREPTASDSSSSAQQDTRFKSISESALSHLQTSLSTSPKSLLIEDPVAHSLARTRSHPTIFESHCHLSLSRPEDEHLDKRKQAEDIILEKIQEAYPINDRPQITLCSIASGGCFQELVIHSKLSKLGYQVHWILVDPIYDSDVRIIDTFKSLLSEISTVFQVSTVSSFEDLFSREFPAPIDVFLCMDTNLQKDRLKHCKALIKEKSPDSLWCFLEKFRITEILACLPINSPVSPHGMVVLGEIKESQNSSSDSDLFF